MKPISGIIELPDDFPHTRDQAIRRRITGIGPPDLVVIQKSPSHDISIPSCHHVAGFTIKEPASFLNLFNDLLKSRPKKLFGKYRYDVKDALYCCWNSFNQTDVRIKIINKEIGKVSIVSNENKITEMTEKEWRELSICSRLRFWMPAEPVFRAIYNYPYVHYPALRLIKPARFSEEDLQYIVDKHPKSYEVEAAIAHYLIHLGNSDQILTLLHKFVSKMPRICVYLLKMVPSNSVFSKELIDYIFEAFYCSPDDPLIALCCADICVETEDMTRINHAIPLLTASMWSSPYACCALARLALKLGKVEDSFYCLNAACFAKDYFPETQPKLEVNVPRVESKKAPRARPKQIELELIHSQLTGSNYFLYKCVAELAYSVGMIRLRTMLRKFKVAKDRESTTTSFKIGKGKCNGVLQEEEEDLQYLYDPGISMEHDIPPAVRLLPLSPDFSELLTKVLNDLHCRDQIMRTKRAEGSADARNAALVALRLGDENMFEVAATCLKKIKKMRVIYELIRMRLQNNETWAPIPRHPDYPKKRMTINEANAFTVTRSISHSLRKLFK